MPKVFPSTECFVLAYEREDGTPFVTSTMHISKGGFEDMMRDVATQALRRAKLVGKVVKAYHGPGHEALAADLPALNAYPQGYTEVYR